MTRWAGSQAASRGSNPDAAHGPPSWDRCRTCHGKNCWTIAEHAGHAAPDGLQHLSARAEWDAEAVRDDLRGYVVEHLGDQDAVWAVDETGDQPAHAPAHRPSWSDWRRRHQARARDGHYL